jgi:hypothetical protein
MKTQDLNEKEIDALITRLIRADAFKPSEKFTNSVMNEVAKIDKIDAELDAKIDALLAKQIDFPSITESTLEKIKYANRSFLEKFVSYSTASAVAVGVILSVILASANASLPKGVLTEDDFAEMTKIDEDIQSITLLVMQEEMLDFIKKR